MTDVNIDEYIRELSYSLFYHLMPCLPFGDSHLY